MLLGRRKGPGPRVAHGSWHGLVRGLAPDLALLCAKRRIVEVVGGVGFMFDYVTRADSEGDRSTKKRSSRPPIGFEAVQSRLEWKGFMPGKAEIERMIEAAEAGELRTLQALIDSGGEVNARGAFGDSLLIKASENNHPAIVSWLLARGATFIA